MTLLDGMCAAYVECALWSSIDTRSYERDGVWIDEEPVPFDSWADETDLSDECRLEFTADCAAFLRDHYTDEVAALWDIGQFGHDFWLTRNHHGAGFWDRGHGDIGRKLTEAAHVYGEVSLYTGDDGKVHCE